MNAPSYDDCRPVKTILLAEDDLDDQDFIKEALAGCDPGLAIHAITNGNGVLSFLNTLHDKQLPQLLLLDYNLPEIDGAEVLRRLAEQARYKAITKIVWSTSNAPQYKDRCLALGAAAYLVKPSTINAIEAMAQQILNLVPVTD